MDKLGFEFLHKQDSKLHVSEEVEYEAKRREFAGESVSQRPYEKIGNFMEVLERTHGHGDDPRVLERIKSYYHDRHVIKPENVPESYFELQRRIAREQGHGDIDITGEMREELINSVIADQETSLDRWIEYMTSEDDLYPTWIKYWAFNGMTKLSTFDKEKYSFGVRGRDTVAPFPDLNREAFAYTVDMLQKKYSEEFSRIESEIRVLKNLLKKTKGYERIKSMVDTQLDKDGNSIDEEKLGRLRQQLVQEPEHTSEYYQNRIDALEKEKTDIFSLDNQDIKEFLSVLNTDDFGKFYAYAIEKVIPIEQNELAITEGKWIKYDKGSDHMPLVESLQGKGTGWCTAGESTAKTQLEGGDFYVYYSNNRDGDPVNPRIAILMEDDSIAEVRGVAHEQNMDPYIGDVFDEKIGEFGAEGELYKKKSHDMKRLTDIDNRVKAGEELSKDDLRFLYEVDDNIDGFGYLDDPRIKEMLADRDARRDLASIFECGVDQIALSGEELLSSGTKTKCFYDTKTNNFDPIRINAQLFAKMQELPEYMVGSIDLVNFKSVEGVTLPKSSKARVLFSGLESVRGLSVEGFSGALYFEGIADSSMSDLSGFNGRELCFIKSSVNGLDLSNILSCGSISFEKVEGLDTVSMPENFSGEINFYGPISVGHFRVPDYFSSKLIIYSDVEDVDEMVFPKSFRGQIFFERPQRDLDGLVIPQNTSYVLFHDDTTSLEGISFSEGTRVEVDAWGISDEELASLKNQYPLMNIRNKDG